MRFLEEPFFRKTFFQNPFLANIVLSSNRSLRILLMCFLQKHSVQCDIVEEADYSLIPDYLDYSLRCEVTYFSKCKFVTHYTLCTYSMIPELFMQIFCITSFSRLRNFLWPSKRSHAIPEFSARSFNLIKSLDKGRDACDLEEEEEEEGNKVVVFMGPRRRRRRRLLENMPLEKNNFFGSFL